MQKYTLYFHVCIYLTFIHCYTTYKLYFRDNDNLSFFSLVDNLDMRRNHFFSKITINLHNCVAIAQ